MQYIPQAPPFVMIDELLSASPEAAQTKFTVREGHLFVSDGVFTEPGLIENMAQTAAAGTGWLAAQQGQPAPVGFIGAVKNLNIYMLPVTGTTLITTVKTVHQVLNAHIAEGRIMQEDRLVASAEFKIFLQ